MPLPAGQWQIAAAGCGQVASVHPTRMATSKEFDGEEKAMTFGEQGGK